MQAALLLIVFSPALLLGLAGSLEAVAFRRAHPRACPTCRGQGGLTDADGDIFVCEDCAGSGRRG